MASDYTSMTLERLFRAARIDDFAFFDIDFLRDRIANDAHDQLQQVVDVFLRLLELANDRNGIELVLKRIDFIFDFIDHFLILERLKSDDFLLFFFLIALISV